jgi:hypothetical protein
MCIWIDAICINKSDIGERNQQVKMMSSIYKRASYVRIWLGEEIGVEWESIDVLKQWSSASWTPLNRLLLLA